uniref:Uncharacterized protein n=1 Tax=Mimivirus LCMiAC01 TaxID=2506608 RepID=A0A481YZZ2_9VIRU|nr:MAG: hypothetical protein LCMiAC01_04700 [Mimivirus LCMiAC01]
MNNKKSYYNKLNKYYSEHKNNISKKINLKNDYKYVFTTNNDKHIVKIYNNDKLTMVAEYELAGIYNIYNSVWYWAWNIDNIDRRLTKLSHKIKKFAKYIKNNHDKFRPMERDELYYKTKNGNFYTSFQNIKLLTKLALYLTNSIWIFPVCYGKDNTPMMCNINENKTKKSIKRLEYLLIKKIVKSY